MTQDTPNPRSLKFIPGRQVLGEGNGTRDFDSLRAAQVSPLARGLFRVEGIQRVFMGSDFVSVTIQEGQDWSLLKPEVFSVMTDFFQSGQPVLIQDQEQAPNSDTVITDEDDDVVAMVKELIETRIRPSVQEDGGDIVYRGMTPEGIVRLQLQGSCAGCPSSSVTLKHGIENMLMHYVPEVKGVEEFVDEELQRVNEEAFAMVEKKAEQKD
jgi:Fe-S cluster biogenesis protein NfuA